MAMVERGQAIRASKDLDVDADADADTDDVALTASADDREQCSPTTNQPNSN